MELKVINNIDEMTPSEQDEFVGGKAGHLWLNLGGVMIVRDIPDRSKKNVNEQASIIYSREVGHYHAIYGNAILVVNENQNYR